MNSNKIKFVVIVAVLLLSSIGIMQSTAATTWYMKIDIEDIAVVDSTDGFLNNKAEVYFYLGGQRVPGSGYHGRYQEGTDGGCFLITLTCRGKEHAISGVDRTFTIGSGSTFYLAMWDTGAGEDRMVYAKITVNSLNAMGDTFWTPRADGDAETHKYVTIDTLDTDSVKSGYTTYISSLHLQVTIWSSGGGGCPYYPIC